MKTACTVQCDQCPFRANALPGWLGDYTPGSIMHATWHGEPFFCHTKINYSMPGWERRVKKQGKLCLGSMVFAKKMMAPCKEDAYPETDPEVIAARRANQDRIDVDCMEPKVFMDHHDPEKSAARIAARIAARVDAAPKSKTPKRRKITRTGPPSDAEINAEIELLRDLRGRIPSRSLFGDDNLSHIDAQIRVLDERMDDGDAYDHYQPYTSDDDRDEDECAELNEIEGRTDELVSEALDAVRWLEGDSLESLAGNWEGIVK